MDKSLVKRIIAICPKCSKKHKMRKFYTGNIIPRYYCNQCRIIIKSNNYQEKISHAYPKEIR